MIHREPLRGRGWPGANQSDASVSDESTGLPFSTTRSRLVAGQGSPGPRGSMGNGPGMAGPVFSSHWAPSPLPGHASPTATRFVKKKRQTEILTGASVGRTSASSVAALQRLSQLEEKLKARMTGAMVMGGRRQPPTTSSTVAPPSTDRAVSMPGDELSGNGSRFLKKKTTMSTPAESLENTEPPKSMAAATPPDASREREAARTGGRRTRTRTPPAGTMDSDEEEMRRLLGSSFESHDSERKHARSPQTPTNRSRFLKMREEVSMERPGGSDPQLSPSLPETGRAGRASVLGGGTTRSSAVSWRGMIKRSPSPASIRSEMNSDDDRFSDSSVTPTRQDEDSSASASDDFKMNLMTIDDLLPALPISDSLTRKHSCERPTLNSDAPQTGAPHPSDKRPAGATRSLRTPSPDTNTNGEGSSDEKSGENAVSMPEVSDVSEHLEVPSVRDGDYSSTSSLSRSRIGSRGGKSRSMSPVDSESLYTNYSEDFEEEDDLRDAGAKMSSHAGGSSSCSGSQASRSLPRPRAERESSRMRTRGSTDSVRKDVKKGKDAAVQTAPGLSYTWVQDAALEAEHAGKYAHPMPIASHFISGETLEALSTHRPSTLVLQELLRGQLELTREFVSRCHGLHASLVEALAQERYPYTTLRETLQFLEQNRRPKLTMEEAQEQVLQEMREYHYL